MVNVLAASIAMPKSCDVQVRCDFLHGDGPKYSASASVRSIIVGWLKWRGIVTEEGIQETAGFPGLSNCLANRKSLGVFLQKSRLTNVE